MGGAVIVGVDLEPVVAITEDRSDWTLAFVVDEDLVLADMVGVDVFDGEVVSEIVTGRLEFQTGDGDRAAVSADSHARSKDGPASVWTNSA